MARAFLYLPAKPLGSHISALDKIVRGFCPRVMYIHITELVAESHFICLHWRQRGNTQSWLGSIKNKLFHVSYIHTWMKKREYDTWAPGPCVCCGIWNPLNGYLEFKETIELEKSSEWSLFIISESKMLVKPWNFSEYVGWVRKVCKNSKWLNFCWIEDGLHILIIRIRPIIQSIFLSQKYVNTS